MQETQAISTAAHTVQPLLLTREQAAQALTVSLSTFDRLVVTKQIRVIRIGRSVKVRVSDLNAFIRGDHATQEAA